MSDVKRTSKRLKMKDEDLGKLLSTVRSVLVLVRDLFGPLRDLVENQKQTHVQLGALIEVLGHPLVGKIGSSDLYAQRAMQASPEVLFEMLGATEHRLSAESNRANRWEAICAEILELLRKHGALANQGLYQDLVALCTQDMLDGSIEAEPETNDGGC